MITLEQVEARTLNPGEALPESLAVGFRQLDPYWTWVALEDGVIVAALLAAPCHGMVMLARLVALPGHTTVMLRLLRQCVHDCHSRNFMGWFTWLDQALPDERRLLGILRQGGGIVIKAPQTCVGGSLAVLGRW